MNQPRNAPIWRWMSLAALMLAGLSPVRADWPEFRGPNGDGHSRERGVAVRWSNTENIRWKREIPYKGWSTPVVMNGQVWLTTATPEGRDFFVIGLAADTGNILVQEKLFHCNDPEPLGNPVNCYAAPSPAVESGRIYAHFGSYGTACLDTKTFKVLWARDDLPCRHYRGPGSSPILFGDLMILTMDGVDVQYLVALDKKTGKTAWKTDRTADWNDLDASGKPSREGDLRKAYSTPLIVTNAGLPLMLSAAAKAAYGYDPLTGRELWKVGHRGFSCASRPLLYKDLAFFTTGHGKAELLAVRAGGSGDVTGSHVAWRTDRNVPKMPSPILVEDLLYMVSDDGMLSCLEAETGREVWSERIGGPCTSSPVHADGRLYFCNDKGKTTVLKPGRSFEVLAVNELPGGFMASPAVSDGALFLRTRTHLYRIQGGGTTTR